MKVYVLNEKSSNLEKMLQCLKDNKRVSAVVLFDDYIQFVSKIMDASPKLCIIQLGNENIPGLKTGEMVKIIDPDIKVVFVSEERNYALDAYEIGANGYLLCPIEKHQMENCLEHV